MSSAVVFNALSKNFGTVKALDEVSFEVAEGEFFGLLGPNGAGKTTLIHALAGLTRPSSGQVLVKGKEVIEHYRFARAQLGVVPQELAFDPFFNVRELLRVQSGYFGIERNDVWIDYLLERLELSDKADKNMRALSGGMKRRVLIAQALVHKPPIIVLDEPTAGVDVNLRLGLWDFIRELNREGHTIILTTHYLEEAETLCSRLALMRSGKLIALESTGQLLKRFSGIKVSFSCSSPLPSHWAEHFGLSSQRSLHQADMRDHEQLLALLNQAQSLGLKLDDLQVSHPDLESVFVRLMEQIP